MVKKFCTLTLQSASSTSASTRRKQGVHWLSALSGTDSEPRESRKKVKTFFATFCFFELKLRLLLLSRWQNNKPALKSQLYLVNERHCWDEEFNDVVSQLAQCEMWRKFRFSKTKVRRVKFLRFGFGWKPTARRSKQSWKIASGKWPFSRSSPRDSVLLEISIPHVEHQHHEVARDWQESQSCRQTYCQQHNMIVRSRWRTVLATAAILFNAVSNGQDDTSTGKE